MGGGGRESRQRCPRVEQLGDKPALERQPRPIRRNYSHGRDELTRGERAEGEEPGPPQRSCRPWEGVERRQPGPRRQGGLGSDIRRVGFWEQRPCCPHPTPTPPPPRITGARSRGWGWGMVTSGATLQCGRKVSRREGERGKDKMLSGEPGERGFALFGGGGSREAVKASWPEPAAAACRRPWGTPAGRQPGGPAACQKH